MSALKGTHVMPNFISPSKMAPEESQKKRLGGGGRSLWPTWLTAPLCTGFKAKLRFRRCSPAKAKPTTQPILQLRWLDRLEYGTRRNSRASDCAIPDYEIPFQAKGTLDFIPDYGNSLSGPLTFCVSADSNLTLARKRCFAPFAHAGGGVRPPWRLKTERRRA